MARKNVRSLEMVDLPPPLRDGRARRSNPQGAEQKFRGAEAAMTQKQGFCGSPWADRNDWVCQPFSAGDALSGNARDPHHSIEMFASFFLQPHIYNTRIPANTHNLPAG